MTERERWTVYPLLFLALGASVKDKIGKFVAVDDVYCNRLVVTDRQGREQVLVTTGASGGQIHVEENGGRDRLSIGGGGVGIVRVQNGMRSYSVFMQPRPNAPGETPPHEPQGAPAPPAEQ